MIRKRTIIGNVNQAETLKIKNLFAAGNLFLSRHQIKKQLKIHFYDRSRSPPRCLIAFGRIIQKKVVEPNHFGNRARFGAAIVN